MSEEVFFRKASFSAFAGSRFHPSFMKFCQQLPSNAKEQCAQPKIEFVPDFSVLAFEKINHDSICFPSEYNT